MRCYCCNCSWVSGLFWGQSGVEYSVGVRVGIRNMIDNCVSTINFGFELGFELRIEMGLKWVSRIPSRTEKG